MSKKYLDLNGLETLWTNIKSYFNPTISNKADKVSGATSGNFAGLDSNGNLTDSGITSSNIVQKSNTTGLLKNNGTVDTNTYLTSANIVSKADKVSGATSGNFAGLDSSGNLTDSSKKASDFATAVQGAKADTAVQSVSVGTTTTGAVGTNANVINSGTQQNPVLDFIIPQGTPGHNPNLGTFTPSTISDAPQTNILDGDYIVVIDANATSPRLPKEIYLWDGDSWEPTGEAPTATFATSEVVSSVNITQDPMTGGIGNVPSSDALKEVATKVHDVTRNTTTGDNEEVKITKDNGDVIIKVTETTTTVNTDVEIGSDVSIDGDATIGGNLNVEGSFGVKDLSLESIELVDSNGTHISEASTSMSSGDGEEVKFCNDAGTEEYAKVDSDGVTAKGFFKQDGTVVGNQPCTIVVDPNPNVGDYTNIVDALNNAGDTPTKHITIIINEGTYNMPPKVSYAAPYVESNRNLTLKGVNRNKCVLQCNIGFYDYTIGTDCAPVRLCGNVTIENLTIISSNEDYDNKVGTPGYVTQRTDRKAAYCIHLDMGRLEGDVISVRNCTLINYQMACIGFGTRKNSVVRVEDCYAQCEQAAKDSDANNYGTIWGHSGGDTPGQRLEVLRCQLVHKTGIRAIRYSYAEESSTELACSACFIGNAVKTQDVENALQINGFPVGTFELDTLSFGNQCEAMNSNN